MAAEKEVPTPGLGKTVDASKACQLAQGMPAWQGGSSNSVRSKLCAAINARSGGPSRTSGTGAPPMPAGAAGADSEAPRQPLPRGLTGFSTTGSYTHASDSGGLPQPFKQGLVTGSGSLWDLQEPPSLVNKLASRTWLPLDLVEGWEGDEEEAGHSGQPREKAPNSQSVLSLDKFERVSYYSRLGAGLAFVEMAEDGSGSDEEYGRGLTPHQLRLLQQRQEELQQQRVKERERQQALSRKPTQPRRRHSSALVKVCRCRQAGATLLTLVQGKRSTGCTAAGASALATAGFAGPRWKASGAAEATAAAVAAARLGAAEAAPAQPAAPAASVAAAAAATPAAVGRLSMGGMPLAKPPTGEEPLLAAALRTAPAAVPEWSAAAAVSFGCSPEAAWWLCHHCGLQGSPDKEEHQWAAASRQQEQEQEEHGEGQGMGEGHGLDGMGWPDSLAAEEAEAAQGVGLGAAAGASKAAGDADGSATDFQLLVAPAAATRAAHTSQAASCRMGWGLAGVGKQKEEGAAAAAAWVVQPCMGMGFELEAQGPHPFLYSPTRAHPQGHILDAHAHAAASSSAHASSSPLKLVQEAQTEVTRTEPAAPACSASVTPAGTFVPSAPAALQRSSAGSGAAAAWSSRSRAAADVAAAADEAAALEVTLGCPTDGPEIPFPSLPPSCLRHHEEGEGGAEAGAGAGAETEDGGPPLPRASLPFGCDPTLAASVRAALEAVRSCTSYTSHGSSGDCNPGSNTVRPTLLSLRMAAVASGASSGPWPAVGACGNIGGMGGLLDLSPSSSLPHSLALPVVALHQPEPPQPHKQQLLLLQEKCTGQPAQACHKTTELACVAKVATSAMAETRPEKAAAGSSGPGAALRPEAWGLKGAMCAAGAGTPAAGGSADADAPHAIDPPPHASAQKDTCCGAAAAVCAPAAAAPDAAAHALAPASAREPPAAKPDAGALASRVGGAAPGPRALGCLGRMLMTCQDGPTPKPAKGLTSWLASAVRSFSDVTIRK